MSKSQYTGLCYVVLNGKIIDVKVRDPYGNENYLPIDEYRHRKVEPPVESLMQCKNGVE